MRKKMLLLVLVFASITLSAILITNQFTGKAVDLPKKEVAFSTENGKVVVRLEIADDPLELQRGLMYRTELCEKCGMLFIF